MLLPALVGGSQQHFHAGIRVINDNDVARYTLQLICLGLVILAPPTALGTVFKQAPGSFLQLTLPVMNHCRIDAILAR
jgi:hypothetical protein